MTKIISFQNQWGKVSKELSTEVIKLKSYDEKLLKLLGDVNNKKILDYGAGPAVLASELESLGANVKAFDICENMIALARQKLGENNVYSRYSDIPKNEFDIVICNLVLCIVDEAEAIRICSNIYDVLKEKGEAYIGFCNPLIFNIKESQLDFRISAGVSYYQNHDYRKIKKEGNYEVIEKHRPLKWYSDIFKKIRFKVKATKFTPKYLFRGDQISDFSIFKLSK